MANLRANKIVGIGSTDAGLTFDGPISLNTQGYVYFPTGNTTNRGRGRGVIFAGSPSTKSIEYLTIHTMGNGVRFGDLAMAAGFAGVSFASATRGIYAGGENPSMTNEINYVTISTTANALDFGDITRGATGNSPGGAASSTRGLIFGGYTAPTRQNVIDFLTIATTGNTQDFGDITNLTDGLGACSSPTRAVCAGGNITPSGNTNIMEYVTIASAGNATDFGDLTEAKTLGAMASNSTRGIHAAGYQGSTRLTTIEYLTIATTGNAVDWGATYLDDLYGNQSGMTNETRFVSAGGLAPGATNLITHITIATTGNIGDFGDLLTKRGYAGSCSDSHGGL
tara:strand:- start:2421 stop:3437 length:1017 start_codon:yes stop_codon:yes gene_type:complete